MPLVESADAHTAILDNYMLRYSLAGSFNSTHPTKADEQPCRKDEKKYSRTYNHATWWIGSGSIVRSCNQTREKNGRSIYDVEEQQNQNRSRPLEASHRSTHGRFAAGHDQAQDMATAWDTLRQRHLRRDRIMRTPTRDLMTIPALSSSPCGSVDSTDSDTLYEVIGENDWVHEVDGLFNMLINVDACMGG